MNTRKMNTRKTHESTIYLFEKGNSVDLKSSISAPVIKHKYTYTSKFQRTNMTTESTEKVCPLTKPYLDLGNRNLQNNYSMVVRSGECY